MSLIARIRRRRLRHIEKALGETTEMHVTAPHDRAFSIPSLAQIPTVRVIRGHQAFCLVRDADHWSSEDRVPVSGHGHATWIGPWRENAYEARLDALEHNIALGHPTVMPWPLD